MLYLDEETRHEFHKSSTLLQIICQILEFECAKYTVQLEVIGLDPENDTILLMADPFNENHMLISCMSVNKQFKRKDGKYTCRVYDNQLGYLKCYVTNPKDLESN